MDRELIERKLEDMERYIEELKAVQGKSLKEMQTSLLTSWGIEHGLQLAIQALIDTGACMLASLGEHRIEEYADVIKKLGERSVIPKAFSQQILGMANFRNLLVHEYAEVDLGKVHDFLKTRLGDFGEFARHIRRYLDKNRV